MPALLRIIGFVWVFGIVVLALTATSQLLFAHAADPLTRWANQLVAAVLWPVAMFSKAGRNSLRARFRI